MKTALQNSLATLALLAAAHQARAAALNPAGVMDRVSAIGGQLMPGTVPPAASPAPAIPAPVPQAAPAPAGAAAQGRTRPDSAFTPGKLCTADDPDFKELRYPEQISYCQRHVTRQMKLEVAAHYGLPESEWHNYEFDHLIPLAIGGNSRVENLWPQPRGQDESDGKDVLENQLYQLLKAGTITQAEAVSRNAAWFDQLMAKRAAAAAAR